MATHDYVIANGTGAAVRSDLNGALAAIVSNNSGATEPATMYAYQWWPDTTTGLLKQRNAANSAWITIGTLASANLGLLSSAGDTMTGVLAVTAGTAALPGIAFDSNTGIYSPGADQLAVATNGTGRLFVDANGNINLGQASSALQGAGTGLTVYGASSSEIKFLNSTTGALVSDGTALVATGTSFNINNREVGNIILGTSNTERARIHSDGRLLVGTSDGSGGVSKLVVQGASNGSAVGVAQISYNGLSSAVLAANTDIGYLRFTDQGSNSGVFAQITASTDGTTGAGDYPGRLVFSTTSDGSASPTERMRITSGGRVLIGTTADPGYQTSIVGTNSYALLVRQDTGNYTYPVATFHSNFSSGNNLLVDFYTDASSIRGSITYNRTGGVLAYNTTSDYRAKTLLGTVENPGETIDALKVYRGMMNGATVERPMLVAHEAKEVAPYCVTGEKDAVNDEGNPIYQQMDHQVLVPLLIAEIQQLRARVAALESA